MKTLIMVTLLFEVSSCIRWLLRDRSFKCVCLFNLVNPLLLSGLLLFFAVVVVGSVGIVLFLSLNSIFPLDSLKAVKNMVDRSLSVFLILSVIKLLYVNQRLNVNILHTVSTKYFLLF